MDATEITLPLIVYQAFQKNANGIIAASQEIMLKGQDIELKQEFEECRKLFKEKIGGRVRGLDVEFDDYKKCHKKDWRITISIIRQSIINEGKYRQIQSAKNEFVPMPKDFKSWLYNKRYTVEYDIKEKKFEISDYMRA